MEYSYLHVFLFMAVACIIADTSMILIEYAGQMFGKEADKWKIRRFAVTLAIAIPSALILAMSMYVPAVATLSFAGIIKILGCICCAFTFGMQAFYIWM